MTIKAAKLIAIDFFNKNLKDNVLSFNQKEFCLEYHNEDYSLFFAFAIDNFGGKIWINSGCSYELKNVKNFYSKYTPSLEYVNSFGKKTARIYNILCNHDNVEVDGDFKILKDENFDENILLVMQKQLEMINCVFLKIKFELDNNLKTQFDTLKPGIFEFKPSEMAILFYYYKPQKLSNYLIFLKNKYSCDVQYSLSINNYKILLKQLCNLNNLNYDDLEPNQSFGVKCRILFKMY